MKIFKFKKNTGCILEVIEFDNGFTVACWQTDIPEVAVYQSIDQFMSVRTRERGYKMIFYKEIKVDDS